MAIIVPKRDTVKQLASQLGISFVDGEATADGADGKAARGYEELFRAPAVVAAVQKAVNDVGISAGLARFEIPQRVCLVADLWVRFYRYICGVII